jgi:RND superfamily putative drug exporter
VVRSFLMPSIAAMLGRWFWWPTNVQSRPPRIRRRAAVPEPAHEEQADTDVTGPLATIGHGSHRR